MGINTKGVLVEVHNSISMIEWYYEPIQCAYQIITTEIPNINRNITLQMTFKGIDNTTSPNSLVSTLLVFGIYPRLVELDVPLSLVT